jgi:hypothetical protein
MSRNLKWPSSQVLYVGWADAPLPLSECLALLLTTSIES